ncbi:unnamed protein product, partial [Ectocarpus fasciculatus]
PNCHPRSNFANICCVGSTRGSVLACPPPITSGSELPILPSFASQALARPRLFLPLLVLATIIVISLRCFRCFRYRRLRHRPAILCRCTLIFGKFVVAGVGIAHGEGLAAS